MTQGEQDAAIILAGHAAERRALRPDAQGWQRWYGTHERHCYHEAGHLVVAAVLGRYPQWAIVGRPVTSGDTILFPGGRVHVGNSPEQGAGTEPSLEGNGELPSDFQKAILIGQLMTGERGWLHYLRRFWQEADAILEAHWPVVKVLAIELREKGVVRWPDIEDVIRRWPPGVTSTA